MKIYVPDIENYKCFVVQSEGVIRAYEEIPQNNKTINVRDYYINSDYIYRDSTQTFNQYSNIPICLENDVITTDYQYRVDYVNILIMFTIYAFFGIYIPIKIFSRLFKKGNL